MSKELAHIYAREGLAQQLQNLIKNKKNINSFDDVGQKPIHYACLYGHSNCEIINIIKK